MKIEQLYTNCLAEAAYYIESEGEVAIIDPLRETAPYLDKAEKNGAKIKYIFETHFHADFVSGHIDLAKKTGAKIIFGPKAAPQYDIYSSTDGEILELGKIKIKVLHTPGHTMESSSFLLFDENGKEHCLFTGDTLFIGDVGRPDLAIKSDLSREDLAGLLYDSLRAKVMTLPDDIIIYPGHGAGSACGKNMSKETQDTLGNQKKVNYALREDMSKEEFVKEVTDGILPPPQYFAKNAKINKDGYDSFEDVLQQGIQALTVEEVEKKQAEGAIVLDVRKAGAFAKSHIPNSIFIGLDGQFAPWVGAVITDIKSPIILVVESGREEEAVTRLSRVGYDNTIGFVKGGVENWVAEGKEVATVDEISAEGLANLEQENINILDVRKPGEFQAEHLERAEHLALDYINENLDKVNSDKKYYVHCAGGYRSMIFISILKRNNIHDMVNILGGYNALKNTNLPKTDFVCPSTLA
ncbi:MBL fold metallo-hydrolase [Sediminitomix flava]|uniref:Glyoxylase-like metal-dependent hydrolase (Beta-lactamase superfamily II) n=1 Tax=Sediminitomix flava TaxID=379075 RepID=A0A315ZUV0_SEDFL|nr:MBL fold metallo-hydrolase [Sediminitomix flava]PWJ39949.1 glyoxylase-like metal-dependent hydrolase (beta-lactamase superfamily II) [Sediminitomix flava]